MDELIAQHGTIHEHELHRGHHGFQDHRARGKGGRFPQRHKPWQGYHVDGGSAEDWAGYDNASQSLGGFEEDLNSVYYGEEAYDPEETFEFDEEDPVFEAYITMQDNGLDCENQEALEYAAEMLQAQSEAFYTHKRAQQKGHTGFTPDSFRGGKVFCGKGKMTSEEKKARIEALKKRTTCRKCGQTGHWSTDFSCPKNRKGGGKGSTSSTTSTATGTGFKGGKKGGSSSSSKPRTVYFTVNEYDQNHDLEKGELPYMALMAYRNVPPPADLQQGVVMSPSSEPSADEMLEAALQEAAARQQLQTMNAQGQQLALEGAGHGHLPGPHEASQLHMLPVPEDAEWDQVSMAHSESLELVSIQQPTEQDLRDLALDEQWSPPPRRERFNVWPSAKLQGTSSHAAEQVFNTRTWSPKFAHCALDRFGVCTYDSGRMSS